MSLRDDLTAELDALCGSAGWVAVQTTVAGQPVRVRLDVSHVESLGCRLESVQIAAPSLAGATVDDLKDWSQRLAARLTYLLESLRPLEVDEEAGEVMMRSEQPQHLPNGREYYELMLAASGQDSVTLRRYRSTRGTPGRDVVDMTLTRDVVGRLADDLIATMP